MYLLQSSQAFDWRALLLGEEEWNFLPEVLFRSAVMFLVAIITLRLIGKRGIMQGVFELVTIITLGSAAGDPMFYKKVGILPAMLVFLTVFLMYRIINFLSSKSKRIEHLVEGDHVRLVKDTRFVIENFKPEVLSKDEIFSDLRLSGVTHLGQVDAAYVEASGKLSVFFLPDDKVTYGLPVRPELFSAKTDEIKEKGFYSCAYCGYTVELHPAPKHICTVCNKTKWVKSINEVRIK
jgi:uncharacterized membrane protein YcaP (DUF421 family)